MSVIDQKRIAKNTLLLYIRMGLIMLISLYTSRVILSTLGEVDFGLYNVIGGIVVSFSFLNGIMSAACQRYFAIELGKGDDVQLKKVFSLNITIFIGLGILILILAETVGLWFLNHKMVIPPDRMNAAKWVYQLSILSFIINMMSTPYRSIIIARENMKVFAYSSVVEAVLKLAIAFLLSISVFDKLISYSLLMLSITVAMSIFYFLYCRRFYKESHFRLFWDSALFKEIVGYTGWNIFTSMALIGKSQGINLILNVFFGPIVNAARGIAYQVYVNVNQFFSNFSMAINPQIIKSYGAGEFKNMQKLAFQCSRFSYFLSFLVTLPILLETPFLLDIWLKDVPNDTVLFTRLILINALIDTLGSCLATSIQATGKVKWYQIVVGGLLLLILPIGYLIFKTTNLGPASIMVVSIIFSILVHFARLYFVKKQLNYNIKGYIHEVLFPIFIVTIISCSLSLCADHIFCSMPWVHLIFVLISSFIITALMIILFGINKKERHKIACFIKERL